MRLLYREVRPSLSVDRHLHRQEELLLLHALPIVQRHAVGLHVRRFGLLDFLGRPPTERLGQPLLHRRHRHPLSPGSRRLRVLNFPMDALLNACHPDPDQPDNRRVPEAQQRRPSEQSLPQVC